MLEHFHLQLRRVSLSFNGSSMVHLTTLAALQGHTILYQPCHEKSSLFSSSAATGIENKKLFFGMQDQNDHVYFLFTSIVICTKPLRALLSCGYAALLLFFGFPFFPPRVKNGCGFSQHRLSNLFILSNCLVKHALRFVPLLSLFQNMNTCFIKNPQGHQ